MTEDVHAVVQARLHGESALSPKLMLRSGHRVTGSSMCTVPAEQEGALAGASG